MQLLLVAYKRRLCQVVGIAPTCERGDAGASEHVGDKRAMPWISEG